MALRSENGYLGTMAANPGGLSDGIISAIVTAIAATVAWVIMVSKLAAKVGEHDRRLSDLEERLESEHKENRETLQRINDKLDRLLESPRWITPRDWGR